MAATYTSPAVSQPGIKSASYRPQSVPGTSSAPQGTFLAGTKVQVGSHRVVIERYLSEGGFAHVYVVRIPREGNKYELAVLKRVAVPDKDHLRSMRTEVETMKKLKGHQHIVTYIDSHASQLKGGGYEVFLLMEFCSGGGLIDFMNTRLQHRLVEAEILKIFADVAEGLACMHYLKPPLLHRDLKVENVLISKSGKDSAPVYKLADFGSTAPPRPAATTAEEARLIEDDVQKHTTMQYRSPEMIDVWRKKPIDEKADIWAMGVFLYKLCYYTTPFEEVGQMAILNATFKYPAYPQFSDKLKRLIGSMLREDPAQRPNIYQVIKEVCTMRGTSVPVKDIYSERTQSESRRNEVLPSAKPSAAGLQRDAVPVTEQPSIPDIAPMRRGRPTGQTTTAAAAAQSTTASTKGDPFAALDSKTYEVRAGAVDELSKRFPSLDDFSIAQERKEPFKFDSKSPPTKPVDATRTLNERVTAALADDAFAIVKPLPKPETKPIQRLVEKPAVTARSDEQPLAPRTAPQVSSSSKYVSTATGTSPPTLILPERGEPKGSESKPRSIWRVPSHHRSGSQTRATSDGQTGAAQTTLTKRPGLLSMHRSKSSTNTASIHQDAAPELDDASLLRAKTMQAQTRPTSAYVTSNMDFLRDQENSRKSSADHKRAVDSISRQHSPRIVATEGGDFAVIQDNPDFLDNRADDTEDARAKNNRKGSGGFSFGHRKRNSLPSISGATKEIFKGRFTDAFKRFEPGSRDEAVKTPSEESKTPRVEEQEPTLLSPIAGSDATPSIHPDDNLPDDTEELPPDVRREMERRRLSMEERRVAEAARQYRERMNTTGSAPVSKGTAIQQRVQTLLDEGSRSSSPVKRTAEGYGRYTDAYDSDEATLPQRSSSLQINKELPPIVAKKPAVVPPSTVNITYQRTRPSQPETPVSPPQQQSPQMQTFLRTGSRPSAPPKPKVLRTSQWPPEDALTNKPLPPQPSGNLAALLAKDLEGVPDYPPTGARPSNGAPPTADDIEAEFSKRYPSLSGIEMVETDLSRDG